MSLPHLLLPALRMAIAVVLCLGLQARQLHGQWSVPTTIELDGADAADRQVEGLAPPSQPDAALSLDALRHQHTTRAVATGTNVLEATLAITPASLVPGMTVVLVPSEAHDAAPLLALNGGAPVPIRARGGAPLAAGDLVPGAPVRLVFDGEAFVVLDALPLPCPTGYRTLSRGTCIADSASGTGNFFQANLACRALGGRLCTFSEWTAACHSDPAFFGTVPQAEWVDHAANSNNSAKFLGYGDNGLNIIGSSGCSFGGWDLSDTGLHAIRCCRDR